MRHHRRLESFRSVPTYVQYAPPPSRSPTSLRITNKNATNSFPLLRNLRQENVPLQLLHSLKSSITVEMRDDLKKVSYYLEYEQIGSHDKKIKLWKRTLEGRQNVLFVGWSYVG